MAMDEPRCFRCRFYRHNVVPHCRLTEVCMFLNAVASGHPFIEATDADGNYAVVSLSFPATEEQIATVTERLCSVDSWHVRAL